MHTLLDSALSIVLYKPAVILYNYMFFFAKAFSCTDF
jgi:hypothetical protein